MFLNIVRNVGLIFGAVMAATIALEGILAIAISTSTGATTVETPVGPGQEPEVERPGGDSPSSGQPPASPQDTAIAGAEQIMCRSDYYAVFTTKAGPACAKNPTNLMPHWGPPSRGWFRRLGGAFRVRQDVLVSASQCACLASQTAYQVRQDRLILEPVASVTFEGQSRGIRKWVCADGCATIYEGESQ